MTGARRTFATNGPLDVFLTCVLHRRTGRDPTMVLTRSELWRAMRTPDGVATLHVRVVGERVEAEAWGRGAAWALEQAPSVIGATDAWPLQTYHHDVLRQIHKRMPGLRLGATGLVMEALIPAILEQKVTSHEAHRSFRRMVYALGEVAPGPVPLRVPPDPALLAALPYDRFHRFGIERKRADTIRRVCAYSTKLERVAADGAAELGRALQTFRGVGPWTAAEVTVRAVGDTDAVSVGDLHLPHLVSWALVGEPRGSDERMLELLEPYRGERARAIRLVELGAKGPPRRAPRYEGRDIAKL